MTTREYYRHPECGGETRVLNTRPGSMRLSETEVMPIIKRYRQCLTCHKRFTTAEITERDYIDLLGGSAIDDRTQG